MQEAEAPVGSAGLEPVGGTQRKPIKMPTALALLGNLVHRITQQTKLWKDIGLRRQEGAAGLVQDGLLDTSVRYAYWGRQAMPAPQSTQATQR